MSRPHRRRLPTRNGLVAMIVLALVASGLVAGCGSSGHGASTRTGGAGNEGAGASRSHSGSAGSKARQVAARPNGVSRRSPGQIVAAALRAMRTVGTVHVSGSVVDNGIPVRLDLSLVRGQGGEGQISENGLAFRLISDGHMLYILGSDAFWRHFGGTTAAKVFRGKWLKTRDSGEFASIGDLASISRLFGQLLSVHGKLAKGRRASVSGQPAIGVVDRTRGGTLFVAMTGKPYPLQIIKHGPNGGQVTFGDFNAAVRLTPPAKAISLPSLG